MPEAHSPQEAPSDVTHDARLVAVETRQKLRDEHVDRRFDAMTSEFSSLDKRVSNQIAGLDHKIEMGFRMLSDELKNDRGTAEARVAKLYDDWKVEKDSESKKPASIKISLLIGMVGIIFPTLSAAAVVIMLVVSPIERSLESHMAQGMHSEGERRVSLLEAGTAQGMASLNAGLARVEQDSVRRHNEQQAELVRKEAEIHKLEEQRVGNAEKWGYVRAVDEWLRDDINALKDDLRQHQAQNEHPTSSNQAEIARLQGVISELVRRVEDMDTKGTRGGLSEERR